MHGPVIADPPKGAIALVAECDLLNIVYHVAEIDLLNIVCHGCVNRLSILFLVVLILSICVCF